MKNILILMLSLFFASKMKAAVVVTDTTKIYSIKLAQSDIKKGNIKFFLQGGIISTYKKGQGIFEKKYKLKYADLGCIMPNNLSIADYNKTVALYMDKKFGLGWRIDVRRDVMGI